MEFRDCFVNRPDYLQWGLSQSIVDKVIAKFNGATEIDLRNNDFNISMWEHYLIKAIFS